MNIPNEPNAWDRDFSYDYLRRLYKGLRQRFDTVLLANARAALMTAHAARPIAFVRHDLDVSVERALPMARLEAGLGLVSTYHVMVDSPFYDIGSKETLATLSQIALLGHEIGLHYDVVARKTAERAPAAREKDIATVCGILEDRIERPVRSVSFHMPIPDLIKGPLRVAGRVSAYAAPLFAWYLSDSRARFREGDPLASLAPPRGRVLQLLLHPVWWGEAHAHPTLRLKEFLLPLTKELDRPYADLQEAMWKHIIYRAADAP